MKLKSIVCTLAALCLALGATARDCTKYVSPFVGTDFTGHAFPGATWPFGMVQLSPDTRPNSADWDGCSGYHYSDRYIYGFSHTHLLGTGCDDLCDVLLMPVRDYKGGLDKEQYRSGFSHARESAGPGWYEVTLDGPQVDVSLTVGRRSGWHRYQYAPGAVPQILVDLTHRDGLISSSIEVRGSRELSGHRSSSSWSRAQDVYFWMEFSEEIGSYEYFEDKGAQLTFAPTGANVIYVRVGISSVSEANARLNLEVDSQGRALDEQAFRAVRAEAATAWNDYLSKIEVRGTQEQMRTFYSCLYQTAIHPSLYSDANGQYRGMDRQVHSTEGQWERYTIFSIWDTFRALHPLLSLIERPRTADFLRSFQSIYDEGGKLPRWELQGYETDCMIGYNSVSVIADAMDKGIEGVDYARLFEAMLSTAHAPEFGLEYFYDEGCSLADREREGASRTLEYSYDAWCVARVGALLGDARGREYLQYAEYWRNVMQPDGFVNARRNGGWAQPFDPREVNNNFTEANSWQYSFYVPQDIYGHIEALGGDDAYCARLDSLFQASEEMTGRYQIDISGQIGQYAHGNEPSHHIPFLYNYAGRAWRTQEVVSQILDELYSSAPDGLCGNSDCGQIPAWYVLASLGMYNVCPGQGQMCLSTPLWRRATVHLESGRDFEIVAPGSRKYIGSALLNGERYTRSYLESSELLAGGTLRFKRSGRPTAWGCEPADRPVSTMQRTIITMPVFINNLPAFTGSINVSIEPTDQGAIYYSRGGEFMPYEGPITVTDDCTLRAYCERDGVRSNVAFCTLHRTVDGMSVRVLSKYGSNYSAGGDNGLVDGIRGTTNWTMGYWQGHQGNDFEAIVDLGTSRRLQEVGAGFCQDTRSWIIMPKYLSVAGSNSPDGPFTPIGQVGHQVAPDDYTIQKHDLVLQVPASCPAYRYLKVVAPYYGVLPEWHVGKGGEAYVFIDEIYVK